MTCSKCGVSVFDKLLKRVNPIGEPAIWWCEDCVRKYEPELSRNLKEDKDVNELLKAIKNDKH